MSDIICRCGEPWDSTGGIHWTHSDLPWHHYVQLVRGVGCPSCRGDFTPQGDRDARWRASVDALSEGIEPYAGWPLVIPPSWSAGRLDNDWVDDEPSVQAILPPKLYARLRGFKLVRHPERETGGWEKDPGNVGIGVYVVVPVGQLDRRLEGKAGYEALTEAIPAANRLSYDDHQTHVLVATCWTNGFTTVADVYEAVVAELQRFLAYQENATLDAYEDLHRKAMSEAYEEALDDMQGRSEWAFFGPSISARAFFEHGPGAPWFRENVDIDAYGNLETSPDPEKAYYKFGAYFEPPESWEVVHPYHDGVANPDVYLLRFCKDDDTEIYDFAWVWRPGHGVSEIEGKIPHSEVSGPKRLPAYVRWAKLPLEVRRAFASIVWRTE